MKTSNYVTLSVLFLAGFIATTYNACSGFDGLEGGNGSSSSAFKQDAFSKTVHPILIEHCSSCHGANQAPLFAIENLSVALTAAAISNVDPSEARIVKQLEDQHFCWTPDGASAPDCIANSKEMKTAVEDFIALAGRENEDVAGSVTLQAATIPAGLGATPVQIEFALGAEFPGAKFIVDVLLIEDYYEFNSPRFEGLTTNLSVGALYFKVNGNRRNNEATYTEVDVPDTEFSRRVLSAASMIVAGGDGGVGIDLIEPVFSKLVSLGSPAKATPAFSSVMAIVQNNCVGCHGNNGDGDYDFRNYDAIMSDPNGPEDLPEVAITKGSLESSFYKSLFAGRPVGLNTMPNGQAELSAADKETIKGWLLGGSIND